MSEYMVVVTYRAVNGWARGTMSVNVVAESLSDAVLKTRMGVEKIGYKVVGYRVYGFIKEVEEAST